MTKILIDEAMKLALEMIKAARYCPSNAIDTLLFEAEEILEEALAAQQEPVALAQEVIGCFHAAEVEGLTAALANTTDEHLKDLVERRLMHALYAAQDF